MSVTINFELVKDKELHFKLGTSAQFDILMNHFGEYLDESNIPCLLAMYSASEEEFYKEVADTIEKYGRIRFWENY